MLDELKRMSMEMPLDRFVRSMVEFTHLRACEEKTEAEINRVLNIDEFVSAVESSARTIRRRAFRNFCNRSACNQTLTSSTLRTTA